MGQRQWGRRSTCRKQQSVLLDQFLGLQRPCSAHTHCLYQAGFKTSLCRHRETSRRAPRSDEPLQDIKRSVPLIIIKHLPQSGSVSMASYVSGWLVAKSEKMGPLAFSSPPSPSNGDGLTDSSFKWHLTAVTEST